MSSSLQILTDAIDGLVLVHAAGANSHSGAVTRRQEQNAQDAPRIGLDIPAAVVAKNGDVRLIPVRQLNNLRRSPGVQTQSVADYDLTFGHMFKRRAHRPACWRYTRYAGLFGLAIGRSPHAISKRRAHRPACWRYTRYAGLFGLAIGR